MSLVLKLFTSAIILIVLLPELAVAQTVATTTLSLSICGDSIVSDGEECDIPGETGVYSTTIIGRQCTNQCFFGPYCGDGILQTQFGEECDDGNNDDGDFCSSACTIEPAGSGGGGSSGGGGRSGGSNTELGDTQISITGVTSPRARVTFLVDAETVGTVRANSSGEFDFSTDADPGTATVGMWYEDDAGLRSITLNNTFDVTQGAITNLSNILLPPTLRLSSTNIDPGAVLTISGQAPPGARVEVRIGTNNVETTAGSDGRWSIPYNTSSLSPNTYSISARYIVGSGNLTTESGYSSVVQLFLGVEGSASTPSDLNRDGSVNLIDFSIMIFWWQTNGGESDPPADINGNGRVSIEDFSILLFNWTG